jgi:hypothetical protein
MVLDQDDIDAFVCRVVEASDIDRMSTLSSAIVELFDGYTIADIQMSLGYALAAILEKAQLMEVQKLLIVQTVATIALQMNEQSELDEGEDADDTAH